MKQTLAIIIAAFALFLTGCESGDSHPRIYQGASSDCGAWHTHGTNSAGTEGWATAEIVGNDCHGVFVCVEYSGGEECVFDGSLYSGQVVKASHFSFGGVTVLQSRVNLGYGVGSWMQCDFHQVHPFQAGCPLG